MSSQTDPRRIAIKGTWDMSTVGSTGMEEPTADVEGYFEYPSTDPDAYLARVVGASLQPAIPHGWYVLIEPNGRPAELEYVLVRFEGNTYIRELTRYKDGSYWLSSITGATPRIIARDIDVEWIYPIAAVLPPSKRKV